MLNVLTAETLDKGDLIESGTLSGKSERDINNVFVVEGPLRLSRSVRNLYNTLVYTKTFTYGVVFQTYCECNFSIQREGTHKTSGINVTVLLSNRSVQGT